MKEIETGRYYAYNKNMIVDRDVLVCIVEARNIEEAKQRLMFDHHYTTWDDQLSVTVIDEEDVVDDGVEYSKPIKVLCGSPEVIQELTNLRNEIRRLNVKHNEEMQDINDQFSRALEK